MFGQCCFRHGKCMSIPYHVTCEKTLTFQNVHVKKERSVWPQVIWKWTLSWVHLSIKCQTYWQGISPCILLLFRETGSYAATYILCNLRSLLAKWAAIAAPVSSWFKAGVPKTGCQLYGLCNVHVFLVFTWHHQSSN